jgi:hypothetical protein
VIRRVAPAVLLLTLSAAGCGGARAGEIACQQRLVELAGHDLLSVAGAEGLERMSLEGCTEDQRSAARRTARDARELALTFARLRGPAEPSESREQAIGALQRQLEQEPGLQANRLFLEFQSQLEGYEMRRRIMREDLERMRRESGRG